jgi:hypothetical protein
MVSTLNKRSSLRNKVSLTFCHPVTSAWNLTPLSLLKHRRDFPLKFPYEIKGRSSRGNAVVLISLTKENIIS